ncbi:hypothetical protein [Stappia indica]|uniref:hypothetical protein n=1 Tax=Stappia indica TaxID=538381 RepID=UPI00114693A4|nr:hypothetical protein [Stappia indica]
MTSRVPLFILKSEEIEAGLSQIYGVKWRVYRYGFREINGRLLGVNFIDNIKEYPIIVRELVDEIRISYKEGSSQIDDILSEADIENNIIDIVDVLEGVVRTRISILELFGIGNVAWKSDINDFFESIKSLRRVVYVIKNISEYYYRNVLYANDDESSDIAPDVKERVTTLLSYIEERVKYSSIEPSVLKRIESQIQEIKVSLGANKKNSVVGALIILAALVTIVGGMDEVVKNISSVVEIVVSSVVPKEGASDQKLLPGIQEDV